jgi:hypothetical protein
MTSEVKDEKDVAQINLKVKGPVINSFPLIKKDLDEVQFKIKTTMPMSKLFQAYHKKKGVQDGTFKFYFDGNPLNATQIVGEVLKKENLKLIGWI